MRRAILIVLDGVGVGAQEDANLFGDEGADTLGHVAEHIGGITLPHLEALGLGNIGCSKGHIEGIPPIAKSAACFGRLKEKGGGKDSTAGHWEICGLVLEKAFKTFPDGFSNEVMAEFVKRGELGGFLGNRAASGTGIIAELGQEHLDTGFPIVYTSADPVFQIAAHENVIPLDRLYELCEIAFEITEPIGIGRVIARPFIGEPGKFQRTKNRKDFSVAPVGETLLDKLQKKGVDVVGVGKVDNLFSQRGFTSCRHTKSNMQGFDFIVEDLEMTADSDKDTLIFANLVDFDTEYGHRNDPDGFARALEEFDAQLPELLAALRDDDLLIITADHGNDPCHPGTDHTREMVPMMVTHRKILKTPTGKDLGTRETFADIGQTLAEFFGAEACSFGSSFLKEIF